MHEFNQMSMTETKENIENWRKRLIFRSWHRGTREMDLLMGSFADIHVKAFSEGELEEYDRLLTNNDPDIYNWYSRREDPPEEEMTDVLKKLLAHQPSESLLGRGNTEAGKHKG